MSNKLNTFIRDNRAAFDDETPSGNIWDNIEASLSAQPKMKFILRPIYKWSIAAAAVLIVSLSIYFIVSRDTAKTEIITAGTDTNKFPPEYASQMNQFVKMIDTKQEELKTLAAAQPELYQKFTIAINQLDSSYNTLKNQLSSAPNTEMLLEAMIQNLQLQLNVLNQQLNIINQIKESKKNSHEQVNKII